jgi:hypothetical protein
MRRAARTDANQAAIIAALTELGAVVCPTPLGNGFPDLLVAYGGVWTLLEVKDGDKSPSRRRLRDAQIKWWDRYAHAGPVALVESVEQALAVIGANVKMEEKA